MGLFFFLFLALHPTGRLRFFTFEWKNQKKKLFLDIVSPPRQFDGKTTPKRFSRTISGPLKLNPQPQTL